ncbi:MAG: ABC transporter ATP-binding protein/permease [Clostridiales Family XIII bacterium]|jgi:ATP-binding cassette subfamily B protein|nr:ABC transporter ATP-binding protein/permease [Clostridiales Family XIII bacterium]
MFGLVKEIKPFVPALLLVVALLFGQAMCDLALPDRMADIVDTGILRGDTARILHAGAAMLAIALCGAVCSVFVGYIGARVAAGLGRRLRGAVFHRAMGFSNAEFDRLTVSSLITRTTNDVTQIQNMAVFMVRLLFYAPIMAVGGMLRAAETDRGMSWVIAVAVAAILCLIVVAFAAVLPKFKRMQSLVDRMNRVVRENLDGMQVVRAFNTQRFEEARFDGVNGDLTAVNLFVGRVMSAVMPVMLLIMNLVTVLVVWVGARRIAQFDMDVGGMMAYMQYIMLILMSFLMMSMMFVMLPRASVSAGRIAEALKTEASVADGPAAASAPPAREDGAREDGLAFHGVRFAYPGAGDEALHDVSFAARPGETVAVIGSTGSGKSTLANLIPRFYDVTAGRILLNGTDIRHLPLKELRRRIGYVPQQSVLFSGTIGENIAYADPGLPEEALWRAAELAQVRDFIEGREGGMASELAQGGVNVSGGQRQRLAIARALARDAEIYIFDDSFSALDFKTDAALRAALRRELRQSVVLIVTQRVSAAMRADRILVLDRGRVVGAGRHAELMDSCGVYREIAQSQLDAEDLA